MATHISPAIKEGAQRRIQGQELGGKLGFGGTLAGISTLNEAKVLPDKKKKNLRWHEECCIQVSSAGRAVPVSSTIAHAPLARKLNQCLCPA